MPRTPEPWQMVQMWMLMVCTESVHRSLLPWDSDCLKTAPTETSCPAVCNNLIPPPAQLHKLKTLSCCGAAVSPCKSPDLIPAFYVSVCLSLLHSLNAPRQVQVPGAMHGCANPFYQLSTHLP